MVRIFIGMWKGVKIYTNGNWEDFSGSYKVSDQGVVMSIDGLVVVPKKKNGYLVVELNSGNKKVKRSVHRIVASTFTEICGNVNEVVNHKNWGKEDDRATNLEWCTSNYNLRYGGNPNLKNTTEGRLYEKARNTLQKAKITHQSGRRFIKTKYGYRVKIGAYFFKFDENENMVWWSGEKKIDKKEPDLLKMDMSSYLEHLKRIFL